MEKRGKGRSKKPMMKAPGSGEAAASSNIQSIFVKGSKKKKTEAAITIQRFFRGWMQRRYRVIAEKKALRRSSNFKSFLARYREHCTEVMMRHGKEKPQVHINFVEVNEYIDKVLSFEINYQMIVAKEKEGLLFSELRVYFSKCKLRPTDTEVADAAHVIYPDAETFDAHLFTKKEVINTSLHIYVPKGTNMVVRKSTWMNPIVDGIEAMNIKPPGDINKATFNKALGVVVKAKNEKEAEKVKLVEKHCKNDGSSVLDKLASAF